MPTDRTGAARGARAREWLARYVPAELAGVCGALLAATVGRWLAGAAAAALAGSIGEGVAFYSVIVVRDLRARRRCGQPARSVPSTIRNVLFEFGPAELLDGFAVRPAAMYLGPMVLGSPMLGVVAGKVAADVVFYTVAIVGYELRKRAAARTVAEPEPDDPTVLVHDGRRHHLRV